MGLRGRTIIVHETDELIDKIADDLIARAMRTVLGGQAFHLALSGGSTPRMLYRRLVIDPRYRHFPWHHTHIWMVDERCVPPTDERSNSRMIRELLVDNIVIPPEQVHPMPVESPKADRAYQKLLQQELPIDTDAASPTPRLDYVLLGMGNDGHTASLFPHTPPLGEAKRWVAYNDGPTVQPPRPRLTLTYPIINSARTIAVFIAGVAKYGTLQQVATAREDWQRFPINGIDPQLHPTLRDGELIWYLDGPAARGLDESQA